MLAAQKRFALLCVLGLTLLSAGSAAAQEQPVCGDDVKAYIVEVLSKYGEKLDSPESLKVQNELYEKFQYCAGDAPKLGKFAAAPDLSRVTFPSQFCGRVPLLGSLFYEQMRCCGYHPQHRMFGCPIDIKQTFGFGWAPFPGSYEHVLTCVDFEDGAGFVPVAFDSVHLADANALGKAPPWEFAVLAKAWERLASLPLDGRALQARSILSWELRPTDCKYRPTWGNAVEYQIRLDP